MGIYPETNALAAALWERIDRTSRQSVCPCDDLIELIPDFDPTPVSSLTFESCGRGRPGVARRRVGPSLTRRVKTPIFNGLGTSRLTSRLAD